MSEVRLSFGEDAYMRSVLKEAGRIQDRPGVRLA